MSSGTFSFEDFFRSFLEPSVLGDSPSRQSPRRPAPPISNPATNMQWNSFAWGMAAACTFGLVFLNPLFFFAMILGAGCALTFLSFHLTQTTRRIGENLAEMISTELQNFSIPDTLMPFLRRMVIRYFVDRSKMRESEVPLARFPSSSRPVPVLDNSSDAVPQNNIVDALRAGETVVLGGGTRATLIPGTERVNLVTNTGARGNVSMRAFDPNSSAVVHPDPFSPEVENEFAQRLQQSSALILKRPKQTPIPRDNVVALGDDVTFLDLVRMMSEGKTVCLGENSFLWPYPGDPKMVYMTIDTGSASDEEMIMPIELFRTMGQYQCICGHCEEPISTDSAAAANSIQTESSSPPLTEKRPEGEVEDAEE